ncbi:purine-nucleoside phosphorylase [bacterium]|nr:purine-nucleoside phosphorylase [bacterium]
MHEIKKQLQETIPFIKSQMKLEPRIAIILGTGMGKLADIVEADVVIPYNKIPHFKMSASPGHKGNLIFGTIDGVSVMVMQGRVHFYEGYTMKEITYPVRVMQALGIDTMFVSNAAGALNPLFRKGDVMLITDHINLMGDNPLRGSNNDDLGLRFPDMSRAYTAGHRKIIEAIALEKGLRLAQGVFVALMGPCYETAAEYRFLRAIGADAVGMSTVPEVIVAVHGGMKVIGFSMLTDMCLPDSLVPAESDEIIKVVKEAGDKLIGLIRSSIPRISKAIEA